MLLQGSEKTFVHGIALYHKENETLSENSFMLFLSLWHSTRYDLARQGHKCGAFLDTR